MLGMTHGCVCVICQVLGMWMLHVWCDPWVVCMCYLSGIRDVNAPCTVWLQGYGVCIICQLSGFLILHASHAQYNYMYREYFLAVRYQDVDFQCKVWGTVLKGVESQNVFPIHITSDIDSNFYTHPSTFQTLLAFYQTSSSLRSTLHIVYDFTWNVFI